MAYSPTPMDPGNLPRWLQYEHEAIAREWDATRDAIPLRQLAAAPSKPRTGMIVYADGVNWNPGSGEGAYVYDGTTWTVLGATGVSSSLDLFQYFYCGGL